MDNNIKRMIMLVTLILAVIPMVIFPRKLGLPLADGSAMFLLYEMIYYGIIFFFFRSNTSFVALIAGSALTLAYRIGLGALFSLMIVAMYGIDTSIAFTLGITKYLPTILLQVAMAPFVMKPVYLGLAANLVNSDETALNLNKQSTGTDSVYEKIDSAVQTGNIIETPRIISEPGFRRESRSIDSSPINDVGVLDRAVAYLAESGNILMAVLVDDDGLPMAAFNRSKNEDVEVWAPLALVFEETNRNLLERYRIKGHPEKIDLTMSRMRVILRRIDHVTLLILAESDIDETVHIRIAQAVDMIRKYMNEKYSPVLFVRAEEHYVSDS